MVTALKLQVMAEQVHQHVRPATIHGGVTNIKPQSHVTGMPAMQSVADIRTVE